MNYKKITSLSNPKIKELLDIRKRKGREKHSAFIIEGPHLIETALNSAVRSMRYSSALHFHQRKMAAVSENTFKTHKKYL